MIKNNDEKTDEINASTKVTSVKSEINTIHPQSSHPGKQPKIHDCLSSSTTEPTTEPTTSPFDCPISPSIALSHDRIEQAIREGDRGIAATIYSLHAITVLPSLAERPQNQEALTLNEEKWEIVKIIDKRRTRKGDKYKIY